MNIASVELIRVPDAGGHVALIRLVGDDGCSGLGATPTSLSNTGLDEAVRRISTRVIGRGAFDVEAFRTACQTDDALAAAPLALTAGIEGAMLDLASRALGVPLHQLLGGRVRDRVRALATDWTDGATAADDLIAAARHALGLGFDALKVQPFHDESGRGRPDLVAGLGRVRLLRDNLPVTVDLVVDAEGSLDAEDAIVFADALSTLEPFWLGDAVAGPGPDMARVSAASNVPLATGRDAAWSDLQTMIGAQSADYVLLDTAALGGVLACCRLASWAEVFHIGVIPVHPSGAAGLAVGLQLAAAIPNCSVVEVPMSLLTSGVSALLPVSLENGQVEVGSASGLGLSAHHH